MLVDNKFIFVSLPRCASTSFYITCLRRGIKVEHFEEEFYKKNEYRIDLSLDNEKLADAIGHGHELVGDLIGKFGNGYDIISVRRNRYERFISLWKHIIDMADMGYPSEVSEKLKSLSLDDVLFYKSSDLISHQSQTNVLIDFVKKLEIDQYIDDYMKNMFLILIRPTSFWHNHNRNIIWFDFDKLYELENWVSEKLGIQFKLERSNGSQHFDCNLKLNDDFIQRYNSIYDYYDLPKNMNTLI